MSSQGHVMFSQPLVKVDAYHTPDAPAPINVEGSHDGYYPTLNVYLTVDAAKTLRDRLDAAIIEAILAEHPITEEAEQS